jgi:hypothetical protein
MAPERPRSVGFDIPVGPHIIERKPESEVRESSIPKKERRSKKLTFGFKFRDLFRSARTPRSILRYPEPEHVVPEYVEVREPRRSRPHPVRTHRSPSDDFVPLPPPVPSPIRRPEEETPIIEIRSPRRPTFIHSPSPPLREHRRRRAPSPSPSPSPIREVETIRIRRLDRTDRGKAERQRARNVEEEARIERERRRDAEDDTRHWEAIAVRERIERQSAEIAAADLQRERENERLERERERRVADREAAVLERERERDRERVRDAAAHPRDNFRIPRDGARYAREAAQPPRDRGAEVIQAAQNANRVRRAERVFYYVNGRRIEHDRHD